MRISNSWLRRTVAGSLVIFLAVPLASAATPRPAADPAVAAASAAAQTPPPAGNANQLADASLPDSPGATMQQETQSQQPPAQPTPQPPQSQQPGNAQNPIGTAAAPDVRALGVPASRPAGAAIAPAKQRRRRSFVIKVAIVVAAAAAVGTVIAASNGSPSRP